MSVISTCMDLSILDKHDARFEHKTRPFRSVVSPIQRRHLERHGRQIIQHDFPRCQGPDRRLRLHVPLTTIADLDLPGRLTFLWRQVAEVRVLGFPAEGTPEPRRFPAGRAPAASQPALAFEATEFRECGPRAADRAITFPPGRGNLLRECA